MARKGKDLTPQIRSRICELNKTNGRGARQIHRVHPTIPVTTIQSTLQQEARRHDNTSRHRSGRPRKLSEEDRVYIYGLVRENQHISYRELLEKVEHRVQRTTLWRLNNELGIRKWRQNCRPALNESRAAKRLA